LYCAGQLEEALAAAEKALRLNPHDPFFSSFTLGAVYRLRGHYEKVLIASKGVLTRNPNFLPARVQLLVTYSESGQEVEAKAEAAEILRISPNFSLEGLRQRLPFKDQAELERLLAGLRKAGLK